MPSTIEGHLRRWSGSARGSCAAISPPGWHRGADGSRRPAPSAPASPADSPHARNHRASSPAPSPAQALAPLRPQRHVMRTRASRGCCRRSGTRCGGFRSSASNRLGLSAFSASQTDSGMARIGLADAAMSTVPSRRTEVVLRGLGCIAGAFRTYSRTVRGRAGRVPTRHRSVAGRNTAGNRRGAMLLTCSSAAARDADPRADRVVGRLHVLYPADLVGSAACRRHPPAAVSAAGTRCAAWAASRTGRPHHLLADRGRIRRFRGS